MVDKQPELVDPMMGQCGLIRVSIVTNSVLVSNG